MKYLAAVLVFIFFATAPITAEAVTIRNKCTHPVAGSLTVADSNVNIVQFRLAPGEKIHLLKDFGKVKLILRAIPDVYNTDKVTISTADLSTPSCYIELESSAEGIKIIID
ncbi:hypothetical protein [Maridesulfovibrio hydrothermalis]|uniref:Uncharacterized protein n=1 Tax=Maridesulfovibrio hydrothermalis AM13 = DSM 14728 TaxID=1121451 RepID=L0RB12_9BACT|nr:hypothetical protein [Maridesulfovibrio hydrothermalis]CCO23958.1 conserved exported protein of unknown function [Maridesulfovibrio hydrothermalis AM13 = DSM 14728]